MALTTYHGSCRCGKIRFEADLDLSAGTTKCNCTYCWKMRWWGARALPPTFRLLAGGDELGYGFTREQFVERGLCPTCKVTPFQWGHVPDIGGNQISVNLACLDDLSPADLLAAPVHHMDGLHDQWMQRPTETRHL